MLARATLYAMRSGSSASCSEERPHRLRQIRAAAPRRVSGRWPWLGHPLLLVSVAVLALNDHVLKLQFDSWWTGKLSDFTGVAVVGTLLSVLAGPTRGLAMTGIGFSLLKTLPECRSWPLRYSEVSPSETQPTWSPCLCWLLFTSPFIAEVPMVSSPRRIR